jgi:hypothetical protein
MGNKQNNRIEGVEKSDDLGKDFGDKIIKQATKERIKRKEMIRLLYMRICFSYFYLC